MGSRDGGSRLVSKLLQAAQVLLVRSLAIHAGHFEQERHVGEGGMAHERAKAVVPDGAIADILVAVLYAAERTARRRPGPISLANSVMASSHPSAVAMS